MGSKVCNKLLQLAIVAALLSGCAGLGLETTSLDRWDRSIVTVKWDDNCPAGDSGCAKLYVIQGQDYCTIHAIRPSSFEDFDALEELGHEVWHCFGATHKELK